MKIIDARDARPHILTEHAVNRHGTGFAHDLERLFLTACTNVLSQQVAGRGEAEH